MSCSLRVFFMTVTAVVRDYYPFLLPPGLALSLFYFCCSGCPLVFSTIVFPAREQFGQLLWVNSEFGLNIHLCSSAEELPV